MVRSIEVLRRIILSLASTSFLVRITHCQVIRVKSDCCKILVSACYAERRARRQQLVGDPLGSDVQVCAQTCSLWALDASIKYEHSRDRLRKIIDLTSTYLHHSLTYH